MRNLRASGFAGLLAILAITALAVHGCGATASPPPELRPAATKARAGNTDPLRFEDPRTAGVSYATMRYSGDLSLDIYYPEGFDFSRPIPVVVIANGMNDEQVRKDDGAPAKDLGMFIDWARLIAANGLVAVTYDSLDAAPGPRDKPRPPGSTGKLLGYLKANAGRLGIDAGRIGFFALGFTSQGLQRVLADPSTPGLSRIRCAAFNYGVVDPDIIPRQRLKVLIVRPDKADDGVRFSEDDWAKALTAKGFPVNVVANPSGLFNYDFQQDNADTRAAIKAILDFLKDGLKG